MASGRSDLGPGGVYSYLKSTLRTYKDAEVTFNMVFGIVNSNLKAAGLTFITDQGLRASFYRLVDEGSISIVSERDRGHKKAAVYKIMPKILEEVTNTEKNAAALDIVERKKTKGSRVSLALDSIDIGVNALVDEFRAKVISEKMPAIVAKIRKEQESAIAILSDRVAALRKMAEDMDTRAYLKSAGQEKRAESFLRRAEASFKRAENIRKRASAKVAKLDKLSDGIAKDIKLRIAEIESVKSEISRIGCTDCNMERRRLHEASDKIRQATRASIGKVHTGETAVHVTGRDELSN